MVAKGYGKGIDGVEEEDGGVLGGHVQGLNGVSDGHGYLNEDWHCWTRREGQWT